MLNNPITLSKVDVGSESFDIRLTADTVFDPLLAAAFAAYDRRNFSCKMCIVLQVYQFDGECGGNVVDLLFLLATAPFNISNGDGPEGAVDTSANLAPAAVCKVW